MDFAIPQPLVPILEKARAFMDNEVLPLEPEVAKTGFAGARARLAEARQKVKKAGLWAPQLPHELGGMGLKLSEHGLISEVLGRSFLGHYVFGCQAPDSGNLEILHQYGSAAQKQKWLLPLAAGEIRSAFAMTEPELPGANPTWMATRAERDGDDYVINGHKWFTTGAEGSAFAVVMAVTNPNADVYARASQIIVPTGTPGYRIVRNISVMGHAGSDWDSHAEVMFENCRVPRENLLGPEGAGFLIAQERLGPGRIHHCMRWIGICERAFELMCQHMAKREMSPGKPLAHKQIAQDWIAESRAEINAARLMVLHAAWSIENRGFSASRVEVSTIKFFVAGVLGRVLDRAIQAHGALGVTDDTPLAIFFRNERAARIYDGPDEVHKVLVARHVLGRFGASIK